MELIGLNLCWIKSTWQVIENVWHSLLYILCSLCIPMYHQPGFRSIRINYETGFLPTRIPGTLYTYCIPVYPQKWVNFLWKRQLSIIQKPSATNEETPITVATLSERPSGGKTSIFDAPIHCQQGFIYCDWAIDIVFDFYRILAKFWLSCSNALSMRGKLF